jgi:hypothetical protein
MTELRTISGDILTIDDEDVPLLSGRRLYTHRTKNVLYARFAEETPAGKRWVLVHRHIMAAPAGSPVDHRDGNGLNNRRSNLRLATNSLNQANRGAVPGSSSAFKGVTAMPGQRWVARVHTDDTTYHLGTFMSEEDAARAYDWKAFSTWGSYALLNFPGEPLRTAAEVKATRNTVGRGKSKYRGVSWDKVNEKWQARLRINGKAYCPGRFPTEEAAARAYDVVALQVLGPAADLNFPPAVDVD